MASIKSWMKCGWAVLAAAGLAAGCETSSLDNEGDISLAELQGTAPAPAPTPTGNTTTNAPGPTTTNTTGGTSTTNSTGGTATNEVANPGFPAAIDGPIHWLHTDVSRWSQTASLEASVGGGTISMPYSKSRTWPARDGVNANPWAIVKMSDGQWYAATFEWLKFGQTSKPMSVLSQTEGKGDHFKVSPLSSWRPHSGEKFYLMVSGLARSKSRNVQERSNVSLVTWP